MATHNETDLRRALDSNEIVPYFQPIVELRSGLLTGFEVLARWHHPQRGTVHPDEFIPIAEKTGLNGLLLGNLLRSIFTASSSIPAHLTLSVNISLTQLTDRSLPRHIRQAAGQSGFPLNRLILEITENSLVGDTEHAYLIANELKEQGSQLALDDFGTGYSSLRHLQALPFDEIKIDASFVRSMTHTRESRKIAAAVIGLGNSLGLITVAEGVEHQTHADMLLWLGCERGQGFLYGRAVPPEGLRELLTIRTFFPPRELRTAATEGSMPLRLEALPTHRLAQLIAIYEGAPIGLSFLDRTLRFVSVNKRFARMDHLPVAHHLGRTIAEALPSWSTGLEPSLSRALAGEAISGIQITQPRPHKPGMCSTFLAYLQPARDEAGEVIGISLSVAEATTPETTIAKTAVTKTAPPETIIANTAVAEIAAPETTIAETTQTRAEGPLHTRLGGSPR